MNNYLLTLIIASEVVAIFLLYKVWQSKEHLLWKLLSTLVGFLPLLGPLCLLFIFKAPSTQRAEMQNRGPRGSYADRWLGFEKNFWKSVIKEKEESLNKNIE
ncbi:MAG: hypothetical protein V3U89_02185 [Methylophilaceae bacterium]